MFERTYRGCTICFYINSPMKDVRSSPCWSCGKERRCFVLDKRKLKEEVDIGLYTRRQAKQIIRHYKRNQGIPGQLRLTEGDGI